MKFTSFTDFFVLFFLSSLTLVFATPVHVQTRDVYVPKILVPKAGVVWKVGQTQTVTWDNSDPPVNITNPYGQILLRKGARTTPAILADGFSILKGSIDIVVPWVLDGDDYAVVLFGDSGNFSPTFTITK